MVSYIEVASDQNQTEITLHSNLINLKNGVFDWTEGKLKKHSQDYKFITQVPIEYNEDAQCPNIDRFLASTLPPDCIELIKEIFAYCLLPDNRFQMAFLFTGTGANGKGTLINLLEAFLGASKCISFPLEYWHQFRLLISLWCNWQPCLKKPR